MKYNTNKLGLMLSLSLFGFALASNAHSATSTQPAAPVNEVQPVAEAPKVSTIGSLELAVDSAGRQRMITQRLLRDYAMVGMGLDYGNPSADLKDMIALFDATLADLKALKVNDEVNKSLLNIDGLWRPIKVTLQAAPEKNKVAALQKDLEALLKACHENTMLISKASGSKSGEIVNVAGRQRMLSQRVTSLYMLKVWGVEDAKFKAKLDKAIAEFSQALQTLEKSPLSTDEIKARLAKVKKSFFWIEMMGKSNSGKSTPSLITRSATDILSQMNEVTKLYANSEPQEKKTELIASNPQ